MVEVSEFSTLYAYEIPQDATLNQVIKILNFQHGSFHVRENTAEYKFIKSLDW